MPVKKGNIPWNKGKKGVQVSWRKGKGKPKIETKCKYCGNIFLHDSWQKRVYCNKKCYGKTMRGKERNCKFTEEWKDNISKSAKTSFLLGKITWNKAKINIYSDEAKQKMGVKKGNIPWNKDKTKETDDRILSYSGKNHGLWNGGSSFEPYGLEFNNILKLQIRTRDGFICQLCDGKENGRHLDVHHIDYDKMNNNISNLICLCNSSVAPKVHLKFVETD